MSFRMLFAATSAVLLCQTALAVPVNTDSSLVARDTVITDADGNILGSPDSVYGNEPAGFQAPHAAEATATCTSAKTFVDKHYVIKNIANWDADKFDNGKGLEKALNKVCPLTVEAYNYDTTFNQASFALNLLSYFGPCVSDAIEAAGGPSDTQCQ